MPFARRVQLQQPVGHWGSDGMLELPQSFGMIYLGEVLLPAVPHVELSQHTTGVTWELLQTFSSYISVSNNSDTAVQQITVKVHPASGACRCLASDVQPRRCTSQSAAT